ncbi:hypothetical protein C2G38_2169844 [Gigaspora rosea]|uniref:Uncharacterized protein n=1 Tax=Gigaspora rosea TaxID=44941 RepID=A0A397VRJ6_9GLOM|nr:hypothetical protein C2G38_2169844 [Gigaspora rosea]
MKKKEEEEDLHNNRIRVAKIGSASKINTVVPCCETGVKVEKGEIKEFKVEVDKPKDKKEKASNYCLEFVNMEREEEMKNSEDLELERKMKNQKQNDSNETIMDKEDVEVFKKMNDFKETKGPTKKEYITIEETSKKKNVPERVLTFDIVPSQVVKEAIKIGKKKPQPFVLYNSEFKKGANFEYSQ